MAAPESLPDPAATAADTPFDLSEFYLAPGRILVRVRDGRLAAAGILAGDTVVVARGARPRPGDLVLAWLTQDEPLLARARPHGDGSITLDWPGGPDGPVTYGAHRLRIEGVVVAQLRSYR